MTRESEIQRRYGAKIKLIPPPASDRQLFLVLGKTSSHLIGLITGRAGKPLLSGPDWVLVEMGFTQAMSLSGTPGVRMVSGVSVNPERIEFIRNLTSQGTKL